MRDTTYRIEWRKKAIRQLQILEKLNKGQLARKVSSLIAEIMFDPRRGTGRPEPLKMRKKTWSRRINHEHRLVYKIIDTERKVLIHSVMTHYGDK